MSEPDIVQCATANRVRAVIRALLLFLKSRFCSEKSVFDSVEELTQLWAYAEDLETFEYTCKEYLSIFAGPVRHTPYSRVHSLTDLRRSMRIPTFSTRCVTRVTYDIL